MGTVPSTTSNPLLAAAELVRQVGGVEYHSGAGGAPCFAPPHQIDRYLEDLASVIAADGDFSTRSPYAERFAICLDENNRADDAFRLFATIVEGEDDVLYICSLPSIYRSKEVADTPGKLGYEGIYRFALLALRKGRLELAKKLFREVVEKTPTECYPVRLQDVRVESLRHLLDLGVKKLETGLRVTKELKSAEAHQY